MNPPTRGWKKGKRNESSQFHFIVSKSDSQNGKLCHPNVLDLFCLRAAVRDFRLQTGLTIEVSWRH